MTGRRDAVLVVLVLLGLAGAYRAGRADERAAWDAAATEEGDINPDPCPGYAAR